MNKPEIKILEDFISKTINLFNHIRNNVVWDERIKARKTASFGVSYNYSGLTYPEAEMFPALIPICQKIQQKIGFLPNNCLLNYYPNGNSSMGYHSDSSEELLDGTGVVVVSLGSERHIVYRLKRDKDIKIKYLLKSCSLLYMDDLVQQHWMHAIPKEKDSGERISLTFRNIIKNHN